MRAAPLSLAFVFISSSHAFAQNTIADWFPTHAGDKWTYEHETRDDTGNGPAHLEIHRWKTEEIIIGSWPISEGTLVGMHVRVMEGSPPGGWRVHPSPAYLIRGDCLYGPGYAEANWDPSAHKLTSHFLEGLRSSSPDFCFPLIVHKTWGAPHGLPDWGVNRPEEAKDWRVSGIKLRDPSAPDKRKTFHITSISSYPGAGVTAAIWFEKGIGVVREEEIHHGTIGERRTRLLRFEPGLRPISSPKIFLRDR